VEAPISWDRKPLHLLNHSKLIFVTKIHYPFDLQYICFRTTNDLYAKCMLIINQTGSHRMENWETVIQFTAGPKHFLFTKTSTPVLLPIQPLVQWVLLALSSEVKQPWCEPHHPSHIMSRLGMSGVISTLPHMPLYSAQGEVCLYT
jgi:hypothetical protein